MPETEVETPAPPTNETVKEEAVKADDTKEEKKDEEKTGEETKDAKEEAPKKEKKEKKVKEPAPPVPQVHKKDFEKDVVYVYQFSRTSAVPSISAPCLKVETGSSSTALSSRMSTTTPSSDPRKACSPSWSSTARSSATPP